MAALCLLFKQLPCQSQAFPKPSFVRAYALLDSLCPGFAGPDMHQGHLPEILTGAVLMGIGLDGLLRLSCLAICSLTVGGMITGITPQPSCACKYCLIHVHTNTVCVCWLLCQFFKLVSKCLLTVLGSRRA